VDRVERARITRAVRRGEVLPTALDAGRAAERAAEERRSLARARVAYGVVAVVAAAGLVAGLVGPSLLLAPSVVLLGFVVTAQFFYLPRLDRNLARAEELNRAAAEGSRGAT
jgi:hypothetical protein